MSACAQLPAGRLGCRLALERKREVDAKVVDVEAAEAVADKAAVAIADEVPEAVALKVPPPFSMSAWLNSVKKKGEPRTLEPAKLHRAARARTSLGLS